MAVIDGRPAFGLVIDVRQAAAVVSVHGEVDGLAAHRIQDEVSRLLDDGARRVVIDLRDGAFSDSIGLGAFASAMQHLRDRNGALEVAASSVDVRRLLEISGITRMLPVVRDLDGLDD